MYGGGIVKPRKDFVPVPEQLIGRYANLAARRAVTEKLVDGTYFAAISGFRGVWSHGNSEEEALRELPSVVRDWTTLKFVEKDGDLPVIDGIDLNVPKVVVEA